MFEGDFKPTALVYCPFCGFSYSKYRPSDTETARLYTGYRDAAYQRQRQRFEPNYTKEYNKSLEDGEAKRLRIASFLDKYIDPESVKTVLDYGGGRGQNIPLSYAGAQRYVFDISGVDPIEGVKSIDKNDLNNIKWDIILCTHVLEHLSDPLSLLEELITLLPPDGFLYLETPYEALGSLIHEHINSFKAATFEKIFDRNGMSVWDNRFVDGNICCLAAKGELTENHMRQELSRLRMNLAEAEGESYRILSSRVWRYGSAAAHVLRKLCPKKSKLEALLKRLLP